MYCSLLLLLQLHSCDYKQWNPTKVITVTSLLQPLFLGPPHKNDHTFSCKEILVNTITLLLKVKFFWPIGNRINGIPLYLNKIKTKSKFIIKENNLLTSCVSVAMISCASFNCC